MAFARDGRTLYFRSGSGLFAAPINLQAAGGGAQAGGGADAAAARRRGGGAPAVTEPAANATARQVTYTVNIEVDRKALRAQVFNEGWRIMKNRFYDAEDARRRLDRDEGRPTRRSSTTSSTTKSCTPS